MQIKTKDVRDMVAILDDIIQDYKEKSEDKKRDWRTYEQRLTERLKKAFKELKPLVQEAISTIKIVKGETRGAKPQLTLEQKVLALLLKHLIGKSNRNMSSMLVLFMWLTDIDVSYKTIERLYSDQEVILGLHNLHALILKKKGVNNVNSGGDGTGYTLTVKKHYASEAQKLKDKIKGGNSDKDYMKTLFVYFFALMDIKSRMYIGYGTSFKSEQEAFFSAIIMIKETGIAIKSLRLDRYYSAQFYVDFINQHLGKVRLYFIPKKNATVKGSWEWKRMLYYFVMDPVTYLEEYFQRNQSESGIAEDKKRVGWKLGQKREDRIDTANALTTLWHNLYWLG
ncbi:MAG: ISNCY family transposase [Nanoarchaeota archaeon]